MRLLKFQLFFLASLTPFVLSNVSQQQLDLNAMDFSELSNLNISALFADHNEPDTETSSHHKRWAGPISAPTSDDMWEKSKCKGCKFMAQKSYSNFDAGQVLPVPQYTAQSHGTLGSHPSHDYNLV